MNTCTDIANLKKMQGLYTYFSHCFDFWKFQFKNEISALVLVVENKSYTTGPKLDGHIFWFWRNFCEKQKGRTDRFLKTGIEILEKNHSATLGLFVFHNFPQKNYKEIPIKSNTRNLDNSIVISWGDFPSEKFAIFGVL